MKTFLLLFAALFLSVSAAFGAELCNPDPFRPDGHITCLQAEMDVTKFAIDSQYAQQSAKIDAVRKRFWALYAKGPKSPGYLQALQDYRDALRGKDVYYLMLSTMRGMNIIFVKGGNALAALTGDTSIKDIKDLDRIPDNLDGGIRPYARPLFARWIAALARRTEKQQPPSGDPFVDAMQPLMQTMAKALNDPSANPMMAAYAMRDESAWRYAYEHARDWAELLASGVDISKMEPDLYIQKQMEADVAWTLGLSKPDILPDPASATKALYDDFREMFNEKGKKDEVLAAAAATLHAPKNSVGGLATRYPVEIGEFIQSPSPNPYYLFLSQLTKSSPRAYAIALAFDPNVMMTMQPAAAFSQKANWDKAFSVYNQLVARYGDKNVQDAALKLRDTPKDSEGRIAGDQQSQPLRYWFQALLKDSRAVIPDGQVAHFRASSYDPRWVGKPVIVRGAVARVDIDTNGLPHYATIHFKGSRPDGFVGFSPYPDMLQSSYGDNFASLIGKTIEVQGNVQSWDPGAGVRILSLRQLRVLDSAEANADFRESRPAWLAADAPVPATADLPQYLAWKNFPAGTKVVLETRLLRETASGADTYTRTPVSRMTMRLESIDEKRAVVSAGSTLRSPDGKISESPATQLTYPAKGPVPTPRDNTWTVTNGEEALVINGKKIAARWEQATRADDPMTFTKTWTSDEIPGGLVMQHSQTHTNISDKPYRMINETIYAPIDGVMPVRGDATPPEAADLTDLRTAPNRTLRPPAANAPPQTAAPLAPPAARPAPATANRAALQQRYGDATGRFNRDRVALRLLQSRAGVNVPDDVRAAGDRLVPQFQATRDAIVARNDGLAEQNLSELEDSLKVIEDFLPKKQTR